MAWYAPPVYVNRSFIAAPLTHRLQSAAYCPLRSPGVPGTAGGGSRVPSTVHQRSAPHAWITSSSACRDRRRPDVQRPTRGGAGDGRGTAGRHRGDGYKPGRRRSCVWPAAAARSGCTSCDGHVSNSRTRYRRRHRSAASPRDCPAQCSRRPRTAHSDHRPRRAIRIHAAARCAVLDSSEQERLRADGIQADASQHRIPSAPDRRA